MYNTLIEILSVTSDKELRVNEHDLAESLRSLNKGFITQKIFSESMLTIYASLRSHHTGYGFLIIETDTIYINFYFLGSETPHRLEFEVCHNIQVTKPIIVSECLNSVYATTVDDLVELVKLYIREAFK